MLYDVNGGRDRVPTWVWWGNVHLKWHPERQDENEVTISTDLLWQAERQGKDKVTKQKWPPGTIRKDREREDEFIKKVLTLLGKGQGQEKAQVNKMRQLDMTGRRVRIQTRSLHGLLCHEQQKKKDHLATSTSYDMPHDMPMITRFQHSADLRQINHRITMTSNKKRWLPVTSKIARR